MPFQLWAQEASIRWRPEFKFYEARTRFLSQLTEKGLLNGWRFDEESREVAARLKDIDHQATLGLSEVRVVASTLEPDIDRLMTAVEIAISEIEPQKVTAVGVYFQHLYPLDGDYNELRTQSSRRLLGEFASDLSVVDYALLLDGHKDDALHHFQVEFGIVSSLEVPLRLARVIGRMRRGEDQPLPSKLEVSKLPEASLFVDSSWELRQPSSKEVVQSLRELWTAARRDADEVLEKIRSTVAGDE